MGKKTFDAVPLPPAGEIESARRVVIELTGVEQAGGSEELRVFLNRPEAGAATPKTHEEGYAGSVHVYGYGGWPEGAAGTAQPGEARAPMTRYFVATDAVRRAAHAGPAAAVTIVAVRPGQHQAGLTESEDAPAVAGVTIRAE
jgi:hypothetical protein